MEIQRRCRSYYWKRVQVLHGGKEVWNETVTESCMGQDCTVICVESVTEWLRPGWCTEDNRQKKVLPTLDNIRTELKQSIGYTGSKGLLRKDLLHSKSAYTRCGVNQKVLMERQDVVISTHGQGVERGGLHRWNLRSYQLRCPEMLAR